MLKLSRISRSLMVVIYTVFICFVTYLAVSEKGIGETSFTKIIIYMVIVVFCVCLYQVIKRRLRDKTDNQTVRRLYRFGYLAVVLVISRLVVIFFAKENISYVDSYSGIAGKILKGLVSITGENKYSAIIINTILVYINSVIIKKIMLNIFENDAVATMSSIIYMLSPISLVKCWMFDASAFNTLFILLGIYLIYEVYDQISEYGLKDKKYVWLSIGVAIVSTLDIFFGNNVFVWIVMCGFLIILSDYTDKTSFKFKDKTIVINKGLITLIMVAVSSVLTWITTRILGLDTYNFGKIQDMFGATNKLYILSGMIVVLFETLAVALNRKNEFKVTFMKVAVCVFGIMAIYYMHSLVVFDALFSMSFILSIGNMYYNREEKIKLLKSGE